ncbi:MAG: tetratricopeptide repeat protein [Pirellulales bacterium]|nr:tetratricopeptide repeat protein [Pirellulales bacterium]
MTQELPATDINDRSSRFLREVGKRLAALALIALVAIAYCSTLWSGFIWNDIGHVRTEANFMGASGLGQIWMDIETVPEYYPLVRSSFWFDHQLWDRLTFGYHISSFLFHALAAVVLWRTLVLLDVPGAWFAAAIFAVHPINVESVAWISERANVLCGLFYLMTLWTYMAWVLAETGTRNKWFYGVSLALFVCALLCETFACTLPFVILVILWWKHGRINRANLLHLSPFLAIAVAMWLLTVFMQKPVAGAVGSAWDLSPLGRLLAATHAVWFYAWKVIWPRPLVFIYPLWNIDTSQAWQYVYPVGICVLLLTLWFARKKIGRGALAAAMIFLIALLPGLGFFKIYPMISTFVSDHFLHLASIAPIALLVASAWTLAAGNRATRLISLALGIGLVAVFMLLTSERCLVFRTSENLWLDTIAKNPQAWMAHNNLGMIRLSQGNLEDAKRCYEAALELRPESVHARNNLGGLLMAQHKFEDAAVHFQDALRIDPDFIDARLNLCRALVYSGKIKEAMPHYLQALRLDRRLARTHGHLAYSLLNDADAKSAREFFDEAISIREDWAMLINNMAWTLATSPDAERRDPQRAVELAHRAVELTNNSDAGLIDTLAAAQAAAGDFDAACETQRRALAILERQRNAVFAEEFRHRLKLFEEKKPYLEPKKPERKKQDADKGRDGS